MSLVLIPKSKKKRQKMTKTKIVPKNAYKGLLETKGQ